MTVANTRRVPTVSSGIRKLEARQEMTMATAMETAARSDLSNTRLGKRDIFSSNVEGANTHVDLAAIKSAVRTILRAVGDDPDRPGLEETPRRVAKMYAEMFAGIHQDPARHLDVTFPEDYDELVLVRDIPFTSMCEHHLLPFSGVAHVGYLPNGCVTGLSKLARVVEEVAHKPQVQERMTQVIAEMIEERLRSKGVAVVIRAEHSCMAIRGVKKHGSSTVTSALRGLFKTNQSSRAEVLTLIGS